MPERRLECPQMFGLGLFRPHPNSNHFLHAPLFFLVETERPLVLQHAVQELAEKGTLPEIIQGLQRTLQKKEPDAWTTSPSLQLVQLFSADVDINGESFTSSHNPVGHHFGSLLQDKEGSEDGIGHHNCAEAEAFGKNNIRCTCFRCTRASAVSPSGDVGRKHATRRKEEGSTLIPTC